MSHAFRSENFPSEAVVSTDGGQGPLRLSEALEGALKDLSEALQGSRSPMSTVLERVWAIEDLIVRELVEKESQ